MFPNPKAMMNNNMRRVASKIAAKRRAPITPQRRVTPQMQRQRNIASTVSRQTQAAVQADHEALKREYTHVLHEYYKARNMAVRLAAALSVLDLDVIGDPTISAQPGFSDNRSDVDIPVRPLFPFTIVHGDRRIERAASPGGILIDILERERLPEVFWRDASVPSGAIEQGRTVVDWANANTAAKKRAVIMTYKNRTKLLREFSIEILRSTTSSLVRMQNALGLSSLLPGAQGVRR